MHKKLSKKIDFSALKNGYSDENADKLYFFVFTFEFKQIYKDHTHI